MSQLIRNDDLRRLFMGAGGAVTAGLLVGAVMRPELNPDGLIPQAEVSPAQAAPAADDTGFGAQVIYMTETDPA